MTTREAVTVVDGQFGFSFQSPTNHEGGDRTKHLKGDPHHPTHWNAEQQVGYESPEKDTDIHLRRDFRIFRKVVCNLHPEAIFLEIFHTSLLGVLVLRNNKEPDLADDTL